MLLAPILALFASSQSSRTFECDLRLAIFSADFLQCRHNMLIVFPLIFLCYFRDNCIQVTRFSVYRALIENIGKQPEAIVRFVIMMCLLASWLKI